MAVIKLALKIMYKDFFVRKRDYTCRLLKRVTYPPLRDHTDLGGFVFIHKAVDLEEVY